MKIPEQNLIIEKNMNGWWCGYAILSQVPTHYLHRNGRWLPSTIDPDNKKSIHYSGYFLTREELEIILFNNPNFGPWHPKFYEEIPNE